MSKERKPRGPVTHLRLRHQVWHVRIKIGGRRIWRSTGCRDRKAAQRRADEIKVKLRDGNFGWTNQCSTFEEWSKRYLAIYSVKKRSSRRDRQIVSYAVPVLGSKRLNEITKSHCESYMNRRGLMPNSRKKLPRPGTLSREQGLLAAMFQRAVEERLIASNPWKGIKRAPYVASERVLQPAEQPFLVAQLNPEYQRLVTVALGTGLRERCLIGISPGHIDTLQGLIHVPADLAKGGKARDIPILPEVLVALQTQIDERAIQEEKPIFGKNASGVRRTILRAAKRAKIPHLTVHDLRRTFATRCAIANMPVPMLQKILGHSSPAVTMKYYVHLQRGDLVSAMKGLDLGLAMPVGAEVVNLEEQRVQRAVNQ